MFRENSEIPIENGHIGQQVNDDIEKPALGTKLSYMAGPKGFEPLTFSLEG
jgi:hypothetical protein